MKVKTKSRERSRKVKSSSKASFFYYLNPKNVSNAVETYGYAYSVQNTILVFLVVIAITCGLGYFFKLPMGYVGVVAIIGMACVPKVIINSYKSMYEQKRFSDVNIYIEQLLYSFRKNPIILTSLQDVSKIIAADSPMKVVLDEAIEHILYDFQDGDANEKALKIIEKAYECQRVKDVHRLLLKVVKNGGDYQNSTKVLLMNRRIWEEETCKNQARCKSMQRMVEIALCITCLCTTFTPLIFSNALSELDITGYTLYRLGTVMMLVLSIIIYTKTDKIAAINWLVNEQEITPENQIKLYHKVEYYDFKKAQKKSIVWACIPAILCILFLALKETTGVILSVFGVFFMLRQHKMDYSLARKKLIREIKKAFPQWLMEMSLLLQTTPNVHAAIDKSLKEAPPVLVPALEKMQMELDEYPESNEPYCNFLKKYNDMDISSAMGMLYSISSGSGGDADSQIEEILEKNAIMLGQMEELLNEKRIAAIRAQFFMPTCVGALKFGIDLALIIVVFLTQRFI